GGGRPRPRRGAARAEDEGAGPGAAPVALGGQDDRGGRRHPGEGAPAPAARGGEGHLMATIVTFAEHRDGKLRRPSLEAVAEGRRLADGLKATVHTVVVGSGIDGLASELAAHGADAVHVFDQPELGAYAT